VSDEPAAQPSEAELFALQDQVVDEFMSWAVPDPLGNVIGVGVDTEAKRVTVDLSEANDALAAAITARFGEGIITINPPPPGQHWVNQG
jgi:hypothetical protein